jgi:hypothetical protein
LSSAHGRGRPGCRGGGRRGGRGGGRLVVLRVFVLIVHGQRDRGGHACERMGTAIVTHRVWVSAKKRRGGLARAARGGGAVVGQCSYAVATMSAGVGMKSTNGMSAGPPGSTHTTAAYACRVDTRDGTAAATAAPFGTPRAAARARVPTVPVAPLRAVHRRAACRAAVTRSDENRIAGSSPLPGERRAPLRSRVRGPPFRADCESRGRAPVLSAGGVKPWKRGSRRRALRPRRRGGTNEEVRGYRTPLNPVSLLL